MKIEGDLRVRLTRRLLTDAFFELRKEKPLAKITVSELCAKAGVGRGTLYAHFRDSFDLNETLEAQLLRSLVETLENSLERAETGSPRKICRVIFKLLEENEEVCRLIFSSEHGASETQFVERAGEMCVQYYRRAIPNVSPERAEQFYRFVAAGCLACYKDRLRREMRPPVEQFADEMSTIITKGVRCLL